jgi:isoleucyl-tRNA synthetase
MLESRPDWCISRQRAGVCRSRRSSCRWTDAADQGVGDGRGRAHRPKGSNSWFTDSPKEILGDDFALPEGFDLDDLQKEENIFDVWFESGCSWHSVAAGRLRPCRSICISKGPTSIAAGSSLSLLPALGATGKPPFKSVLTHGFTVDEKGMKQSKSPGNYVSALDEIAKYGADILRLWVASVNYQEDVRCSDELIGRLQDAYRKIRNTLRYLLSNINGFEPALDASNTTACSRSTSGRWKVAELIADVHGGL